jgi:diketogulonate reductase-like aldo/keto reductase
MIISKLIHTVGQKSAALIREDRDIVAVAQEIGNGVTPTQVILAWGVSRGTSVIPKVIKLN